MDFSRYWILDGGLATEVEKRGFCIQDDPLWSARLLSTNPDVIADIHKSYLRSGADIIITGSYQASVEGFCKYLKVDEDEALALIGQSVAVATEARMQFTLENKSPNRVAPLIAGSVGPYGACQHDLSEYHGNYVDRLSIQAWKGKLDSDRFVRACWLHGLQLHQSSTADDVKFIIKGKELQEWHRPRVAKLTECGADLLAIETIPALKEAEALMDLLLQFPSTKAWISFSCKDGAHTCHGELFSEAVRRVATSPQVLAVGVNCTSSEYVESLMQSALGVSDKPFIVYPNSGETWSNDRGWLGNSRTFLSDIPKWISLGAKIIGGCCRVGPEEIQKIREIVVSFQ